MVFYGFTDVPSGKLFLFANLKMAQSKSLIYPWKAWVIFHSELCWVTRGLIYRGGSWNVDLHSYHWWRKLTREVWHSTKGRMPTLSSERPMQDSCILVACTPTVWQTPKLKQKKESKPGESHLFPSSEPLLCSDWNHLGIYTMHKVTYEEWWISALKTMHTLKNVYCITTVGAVLTCYVDLSQVLGLRSSPKSSSTSLPLVERIWSNRKGWKPYLLFSSFSPLASQTSGNEYQIDPYSTIVRG